MQVLPLVVVLLFPLLFWSPVAHSLPLGIEALQFQSDQPRPLTFGDLAPAQGFGVSVFGATRKEHGVEGTCLSCAITFPFLAAAVNERASAPGLTPGFLAVPPEPVQAQGAGQRIGERVPITIPIPNLAQRPELANIPAADVVRVGVTTDPRNATIQAGVQVAMNPGFVQQPGAVGSGVAERRFFDLNAAQVTIRGTFVGENNRNLRQFGDFGFSGEFQPCRPGNCAAATPLTISGLGVGSGTFTASGSLDLGGLKLQNGEGVILRTTFNLDAFDTQTPSGVSFGDFFTALRVDSITLAGFATVSAPEPPSFIMVSTGVVFLAWAGWWRQKSNHYGAPK